MLVNPSGAEPTECIYPRAAVAPLPDPGLRISQPLRGCRVLRLSEHGRATPSDTIYCIYLCISPEGIERLVAFGVHKLGYGQRKGDPPMAKNYAMTAIRRSLVEAHSAVTPGQDAKRPQPVDSSKQGKSASKRLTSIFDAHNHRGPHDCPHHASIVVAAPCAGQQGTCIQQPEDVFLQALVHKDVGRHKARPLQLLIIAIE